MKWFYAFLKNKTKVIYNDLDFINHSGGMVFTHYSKKTGVDFSKGNFKLKPNLISDISGQTILQVFGNRCLLISKRPIANRWSAF